MRSFDRSARLAVGGALLLAASGCLESDATGTVTEFFARGIVYGVVRTPDGGLAPNVRIDAALYPIDRSQLESGSCVGALSTGRTTTTDASGRYRLELDGFLGREGVGCVQLHASPTDHPNAGAVTVNAETVKYLLTRPDSTRMDIVLPRAE